MKFPVLLRALVAVVALSCVLNVAHSEPTAVHSISGDIFHTLTGGSNDVWHPTEEWFKSWFGFDIPSVMTGETFSTFRQNLLKKITTVLEAILHPIVHKQALEDSKSDYPYFRFIPQYMNSLKPDGQTVSWSAQCFQETSAVMTTNSDGSYTVTMTLAKPSSWSCVDVYLIATADGLKFERYFFHGTHTFKWSLASGASASEQWDLEFKGLRFFRFVDDVLPTIGHLFSTALLYEPELTKSVSDWAAKMNMDFMQKYASFQMRPRTIQSVDIDESLIHSGDFFGIVRLDGLDPMLAWAMGSTTGHTTIALRIDGQLNVCESTTKDSYWPTNGIQCTPYKTWVQQARAADYNVVWAPLAPQYRSKFNETAALEWFRTVEGFDYGYYNMLLAWVDTPQDNYPCLAPDYKVCLQWEHVEILFTTVEKLVPSISSMIIGQALNQRVGNTQALNTKLADVFYTAHQQGVDIRRLPTLPEQDNWIYNTTRNGQPAMGPSMVCCVFVCKMWKAAGIFSEIDNDFQCTEMTNWDDYALALFDTSNNPPQCAAADPDSPLCQMEGKYTLRLNNFNSHAPYRHMAETCPSEAPNYAKPANC